MANTVYVPKRRSTLGARSRDRMLPEVQALRAIAVSYVVIYHLWPAYLPGGYSGVDIFFVISGFLITSHIFRGIDGDGFSLREFYARRIRRLLPASLLVLLMVAVVSYFWLPQTLWGTTGQNIVGSALYVENWVLAANSVNYLGAATDTIATQHYWSLSVEEQFYLIWPALLALVAWLATRNRRTVARRAAIATVGGITVASFAFSLFESYHNASAAYFVTPTRGWEFGIGGLIALAGTWEHGAVFLRTILRWIGLIAIAIGAFVLHDSTPFPGWAALLPVLGASAVIFAGDLRSKAALAPVVRWRPVQFLGDISYSLYLWHWPAIVFLPFLIEQPLGIATKLAILLGAVLVAWLSKRFVEDPLRAPWRLPARLRMSRVLGGLRPVFVFALLGMVVVGGVGGGMWASNGIRTASASAALKRVEAKPPQCFGAAALQDAACGSDSPVTGVYPDPVLAKEDIDSDGCQQTNIDAAVLTCEFGSSRSNALPVALVGDSHAAQWMKALQYAAVANNWHVTTYLRSGCRLYVDPRPAVGAEQSCAQWNAAVEQRLMQAEYSLVFVSGRSSTPAGVALTPAAESVESKQIDAAWRPLITAGSRIVAIRDVPQPVSAGLYDPASCVLEHERDAKYDGKCTLPRASALVPDPQVASVRSFGDKATLIDLSDLLCPTSSCQAVVGGVLVYGDSNHMTHTYSGTLGPGMEAALRAAGIGPS